MTPKSKSAVAEPRLAGPAAWAARIDGRNFKIVGLGGIGTWLSQALALFLASLRADCTVWLIDGDSYEESNRSRALFHSYGNKASVKAAELAALAPGGPPIVPVPRYVNPRNVRSLVEEGDIVLMCVDNHKTRKCVSTVAAKLKDVLLISGGNDTGAFGNVLAYCRENGRDVTNPLTQFHPEIARPADKAPYELSCAEMAQSSAPQLLYTNLQVATSMLCALLAWLNRSLEYEEVYLDILDARMTAVKRQPARSRR